MNASMARTDPGHLPAVLTVGQAAELLGIGRSHAYETVKSGEWPTRVIRIGRCIRIPAAEVLRLLVRITRSASRRPVVYRWAVTSSAVRFAATSAIDTRPCRPR